MSRDGSDWDYINEHMGGHGEDALPNFMNDPCFNDDWEQSLRDKGYQTVKEWNSVGRSVKKGEKGKHLPCARITVFAESQTIENREARLVEEQRNDSHNNQAIKPDSDKKNDAVMNNKKAFYILENLISRIEIENLALSHITPIELESLKYSLGKINSKKNKKSSSKEKTEDDFDDDIPF